MNSRNKDKLPITRIASIDGFGGMLLGRDIAEIFKEGHVYGVQEIMGEIILTDLGKHAKSHSFKDNRIGFYAVDGTHCFTKEEYENVKTTSEDY